MQKRLLLIDNHDSFTYNLVDLIRQLAVPFELVTVENLPQVEMADFTHIIISPGPDVPFAYPQTFEMLEKYHTEKAILGVCLGHQTLCEFFGGSLYNLKEVRHGQAKRLKVRSNSALFSALPTEFDVGLYHSWAVNPSDFPAELRVSATCSDEIIMAFEHKTLPIFGVQFHPESYMSAFGLAILQNFINRMPLSPTAP